LREIEGLDPYIEYGPAVTFEERKKAVSKRMLSKTVPIPVRSGGNRVVKGI